MAGTVHEVENHALLAEVEREAANAAQELVEAARLHRGQIVVKNNPDKLSHVSFPN